MTHLIQIRKDGDDVVVCPPKMDGFSFGNYRRACRGPYNGTTGNVIKGHEVVRVARALEAEGFAVEVEDGLAKDDRRELTQAALDRLVEDEKRLAEAGIKLYPFQRAGIPWIAGRHNALLTDDPGLGKTCQTLLAMRSRAIVVCPAYLKLNWAKEVEMWRPDLTPVILSGRGSFRWPKDGEVVITNYEILPGTVTLDVANGVPPIPEGQPLYLIADECHAVKNLKSQRAKRVRRLVAMVEKEGGFAWGVTGTELLNREEEPWAIMTVFNVAKDAFGSWGVYRALMNGVYLRNGEPDPQVIERFRLVSLKRRKDDVLHELPPKRHQTIPVELDGETLRLCDEVVEHLLENGIDIDLLEDTLEITKHGHLNLSLISRALTALSVSKTGAALEVVESYEEAGEPVIVFSTRKHPVNVLAKREGWEGITGDTPHEERQRIKERFQAGELKGIAGTIGAMGTGVTLTRSATVLRIDRDWTPDINRQAEDRAHRIGQTRGVLVMDLIGTHALDERLTEVILRKAELIAATTGAAARTVEETEEEVVAVINAY